MAAIRPRRRPGPLIAEEQAGLSFKAVLASVERLCPAAEKKEAAVGAVAEFLLHRHIHQVRLLRVFLSVPPRRP